MPDWIQRLRVTCVLVVRTGHSRAMSKNQREKLPNWSGPWMGPIAHENEFIEKIYFGIWVVCLWLYNQNLILLLGRRYGHVTYTENLSFLLAQLVNSPFKRQKFLLNNLVVLSRYPETRVGFWIEIVDLFARHMKRHNWMFDLHGKEKWGCSMLHFALFFGQMCFLFPI